MNLRAKGHYMGITHYSLLGLIVLIIDIYVIINVISSQMEPIGKLFWILIIIIFPVLGALLWVILGPRGIAP